MADPARAGNVTLSHVAYLILAVLMLGGAAHAIAQSLVADWVPFGSARTWLWTHGYPTPNSAIGGFDPDDPADLEHLRASGIPLWRYRVGYLLTCPFCMGFYPSAALGLAFLQWPHATLDVALVLDVWAAQRWLAARSK